MHRRIGLCAACLLMPAWVAALILWPAPKRPNGASQPSPLFFKVDPKTGPGANHDDGENGCPDDDRNKRGGHRARTSDARAAVSDDWLFSLSARGASDAPLGPQCEPVMARPGSKAGG
jgi:hypothetical protein